MRNPKALAMLILSVVIGLGAAFFAAGWLSQQTAMASNKVVVAAVDIDLGSPINPQMLSEVEWPAGSVPPGVFRDVRSLQDRVVKTSILRGEPVLEAKLAPVGTKGGLSAVIAEGKRAITVKVNEVIGVAGFALPGNYVDVLVNTQQDAESNDSKQISKIVLKHMLVLAVAQEASRDETKPKVVSAVTLEVTPEEAEKLDLARSVGTLSLVLRNQVDKDEAQTTGIRKVDLLQLPEAPPPPKAAPKAVKRSGAPRAVQPGPSRDKVEVIRGVQKSIAEL
jgi:pilus assembly protein CpaB